MKKEKRKLKSRRQWMVATLCASPLIALIDLLAFTESAHYISAASDMSVLFGAVGLCGLLLANYFLIQFIINKTTK